MEDKILTINSVFITDSKYVTFWFEGEKELKDKLDQDYNPTGDKEENFVNYDCRYAELVNAIERADLTHELYNRGIVGKKLKWTYKNLNWEMVGFV
jgi:hypothetical protein